LKMDHLGCIIHSLQCVIKKEMFSDPAIKRILDIARRIANYSAMSIQLNNFLREIQGKLGQELLSLINDCKTRWDSTFLMAERILKLEPVIKELLKNHDWRSKLEGKNKKKRVFEDQEMNKELDISLSASDWNLLSTVVSLLKPFHEATLEFSKATANISKVVPMITTLLESVQEKRLELKPVKDLKKKIRRELTDRLGKVESIDRYAIATLCDPTIKANLFRDQELLDLAKKELERLVLREAEQNNNNGDTNVDVATVETTEDEAGTSPNVSLMDIMRANLKKKKITTVNTVEQRVESMMKQYFDEELEPVRTLKYWKDYKTKAELDNDKVKLAFVKVAAKFLTPPPSTVDVERLFSVCGTVMEPKRNRLLPSSLEKIVFMRTNFLACNAGIEFDE